MQITSDQLLGKTKEHLYDLYKGLALHQDMKKDFDALVFAAHQDGIELRVASGYRSFDRQLHIWNNKYSGKTAIKSITGDVINPAEVSPQELVRSILLYSALPGASRHHWGCDIDVYAANLLPQGYQLQLEPWEYSKQGPLADLSTWLNLHAYKFGFYLPYLSYNGGVAEEPWHLSYLPLAEKYQQAFNVDLLSGTLAKSNILGKETIINELEDIAERYINNVCKAPANVIITEL